MITSDYILLAMHIAQGSGMGREGIRIFCIYVFVRKIFTTFAGGAGGLIVFIQTNGSPN